MRRTLAVGALLHGLAPPLLAGPWNAAPGEYYVKASYAYLATDELATPRGDVVQIPTFSRHEGSLYREYGITSGVMAVGDVAFVRRTAIEEFDAATGFGDTRMGLQWQVGRSGPWVFATRGVLQLPTGDETLGQALLPSGSGVWEGEGVAGAGVSLWQGRGWAFVEAGYQVRGGGLRDGSSTERSSAIGSAGSCSWRISGASSPGTRSPPTSPRARRRASAIAPPTSSSDPR